MSTTATDRHSAWKSSGAGGIATKVRPIVAEAKLSIPWKKAVRLPRANFDSNLRVKDLRIGAMGTEEETAGGA